MKNFIECVFELFFIIKSYIIMKIYYPNRYREVVASDSLCQIELGVDGYIWKNVVYDINGEKTILE